MSEFWAQAAAFVWGPVTVALLMGTGIYLSSRLKFTHLRHFGLGWRFAAQGTAVAVRPRAEATPAPAGIISPWQSMMTMLAGAIGNGNIAGVATAIAIGGPGAVFWMWASGLFAMATKYSEAVLGLKFREQLKDGSVAGGPMYYLKNGVRSPVLAWIFAFLAGMAAMTTGPLAQTNSMALVLHSEFHIPKWLTGVGVTIGTWLVVIGGIKSIARFAEKLVPLKVFLYVGGSLYVVFT
ncbi:MAG: alanine:cation symporter family protein, partial [Thermodesulfobacteriota bacterium]